MFFVKINHIKLFYLFKSIFFKKLPGGWLSFRFGGRVVLCFSMFIGSLMTITLPFFARYSYNALFIGLFITGACHGAFFPSVSCASFFVIIII